jgi:uncharacterized membrane protein YhaH (DUF805 family)
VNVIGHLRSLLRFSGREARQPFWLWVLAVIATAMIVWMGYFFLLFAGLTGGIEKFARDHPDQVTRTVGPGSYSIQVNGYHPEIMPDFTVSVYVMSVIAAVAIALLAAAVARRLHDSGRSGWWGVPTPVLLVGGLAMMARLFTKMQALSADPTGGPPPAIFADLGVVMAWNLIYLGSVVMLIILCSMAGTPGDNRYGSIPQAGGMG